MLRQRKTELPQPQDWQHRPGAPGYFVTKDGRFQMLLDEQQQFILCKTEQTEQGFAIVQGPAADPESLGIPTHLVAEAEDLTLTALLDQIRSGQEVTITLAGDLGKLR